MSELAFVVIVVVAVLVAASGIFTAARKIPEDEKPRRVDLTATSILDDIGREVDAKVFR